MTTTTDHSLDAHAQAGAMNDVTDPDPEVPERARGPRRYSAKYKVQILEEYEGLDKAGKGALLRREGLVTSCGSVVEVMARSLEPSPGRRLGWSTRAAGVVRIAGRPAAPQRCSGPILALPSLGARCFASCRVPRSAN